jgi:inorganic phosphate transporter, PiT family
MNILIILIISSTIFLAYANGSNDNFKGVATLFGSGTTDFKKAIFWATASTFAGSICALFVGRGLIKTFSGKGLVPAALIQDPMFLIAVMLGASLTVYLASKTGIPVSTTHSLMGALVGSGLVAAGGGLKLIVLGQKFILPLLLSPFLAVALILFVYPALQWGRKIMRVNRETCVCIGEKVIPVGPALNMVKGGSVSALELRSLNVHVDDESACKARVADVYRGNVFGISAQSILDYLHFLSAGAVSFARGLNDTPKIVAIGLAAGVANINAAIFVAAVAMAVGGLVGSRRVAETMSHRLTTMNHGQGFSANIVTAFIVIFASKMGMPVSTTHVSCGSLFGLGAVNGGARWKTIAGVFSAWILTLPIAAALSAGSYFILKQFG